MQTAGHAGPDNVLHFGRDHGGSGSWGTHVGADGEEVFSVDKTILGNMRPAVRRGPQERPTETAGHAGPANVLRFRCDHGGSGSWGMHVGADEEEAFSVDKMFSGNMIPAVRRGPPERPMQTAGHAGPDNVLRF